MLNEITTSSSLGGVDLNTPEGCINAAINVQNNYKESMLLIVEKWTAPKEWGGHELPIEQLAEAIKRSPKTLKSDYMSVLRKQGRLPKAPPRGIHAVSAGRPAKPVENSTPTPVTPVTTETYSPIHDLRTEPEPVLASVTVVDDTAERDYEQALEHIDAIIALTKKYFHTGWDSRKWYELAGECRTIEACCTNHCGSNFGAGSQRSCG
jgi:hypothetical protein